MKIESMLKRSFKLSWCQDSAYGYIEHATYHNSRTAAEKQCKLKRGELFERDPFRGKRHIDGEEWTEANCIL